MPGNRFPILRKISITFAILTLILLALIAYFLVGSAKVVVTPRVQEIAYTVDITVRNASQANEEPHVITGTVWEEEREISDVFHVKNTNEERVGRAKGEITIINEHSQSQTLVATTRFLTPDKILFRLDNRVVIPANSSVKATLTADQEGGAGDVLPPMQLTIPGLRQNLQSKIYGTVDKPFSGGMVRIGILTENDITHARDELKGRIVENVRVGFLADILEQTPPDTPVNAPEVITTAENITETLDANVGDEVSQFTLSLTQNIQGIAFNKEDLVKAVQATLISSLNEGEEFIGIDTNSLTYEASSIDLEDQEATLAITIAGETLATQPRGTLTFDDIRGMNEIELREYINKIPGIDRIDISFSPFWVKRVPQIKSNVDITVTEVE